MANRFFSWTTRFGIIVLLIATVFSLLQKQNLPKLSFEGFLGLANTTILLFLFVLTVRHFLVLFFSSQEEIKRESIQSSSNISEGISILVPAYNEELVIADTIKSLKNLDYPNFEVIIIDDGSTDETSNRARILTNDDIRFRIFKCDNGGKARALNLGILKSNHEFLFCMDADSQISPQSLNSGMRHFQDPAVGAVAGAVHVLNSNKILGRFQSLEYLTGLNFFKSAQSFLGMVTIIPGPSGLFRKGIIQKLNGYQADTFAEDADLTLRIGMAGHKIVYEPQMEVYTEVPDKITDLIKQRYRWNRGILQATKKHLGALLHPFSNPRAFLLMIYMLAETLIFPILNLSVLILSLFYAFSSADFSTISIWFLQLTLLDLAILMFALTDLRWSVFYVFFAVINRFTYSFFQDTIKLLSSIEELLSIKMSWGKLDRIPGGNKK